MQKAVFREPADMSWARAVVLATGFFFLVVIYTGQIPAFFQLIATQATLARMEQSLLELGLLTLGIGLIGLTISFLYDPKPVSSIFIGIFGLMGAGFAAAGAALMGAVFFGVFHKYLPDQTIDPVTRAVSNWPDPSKSYLLHPALFQPESIDLSATGFVLFLIGAGILSYVVLYFPHRAGKLTGALRSMLVQLSAGGASALLLAYLTLYTFLPNKTTKTAGGGWGENIVLALAFFLVLFALQVWLLPVMTAPGNRQRYMPANYLHSLMILGTATGPLLTLFVLLYPLVNFLANQVNPTSDNLAAWFVSCSIKSQIPASCTFTPNVGYLVAAIVSGQFFSFLLAAAYLWNKKPAFVRLGTVYAFIFAAAAVVVTHTTTVGETPIALVLGISVLILGVIWTVSTQREFVPATARVQPLGCTGQWLVWGSLLFIYLAGFALFSFPEFLETEPNIVATQGSHTIHDAYWVFLLMGALAAVHFAFLVNRRPIGILRKATLWTILVGIGFQVAGAIRFNLHDPSNLINALYYAGIAIEVAGILIGIWSALQTRDQGGMAFLLLSAATVIIGGVGAYIWYINSFDELAAAFSIFTGAGAVVFSIFGADAPDRWLVRLAGNNSRSTPALPRRQDTSA